MDTEKRLSFEHPAVIAYPNFLCRSEVQPLTFFVLLRHKRLLVDVIDELNAFTY